MVAIVGTKTGKLVGDQLPVLVPNANHAFLIGDSFEILRRGNSSITFHKGELTRDQLLTQMTGDEDLSLLDSELRHLS
jgi:simple sugar transport system ATP-binding protein